MNRISNVKKTITYCHAAFDVQPSREERDIKVSSEDTGRDGAFARNFGREVGADQVREVVDGSTDGDGAWAGDQIQARNLAKTR